MSTRAIHVEKASEAWQLARWQKWPTEAHWPGVMDLYEAAAFCRVSWATIRRACIPDSKGNAELAHQRCGAAYRLRKTPLLAWGSVAERKVAA